jgi:hypothetical protein
MMVMEATPVQSTSFAAWKQDETHVQAGYGFSLIDLPSQWQATFEKAKATQALNTTDNKALEVISSSFDSLTEGAKSVKAEAEAMTAKGDVSPSEMVHLTMRCHEFMFRAELTSTAANKTSDGIQQLFRQQS